MKRKEDLTVGQQTWLRLNKRAREARVKIEIRAAIVAADATVDEPDEYAGVGVCNGWSIHRDLEEGKQISCDTPYSDDSWVGWLAREIYWERRAYIATMTTTTSASSNYSSTQTTTFDDGEN